MVYWGSFWGNDIFLNVLRDWSFSECIWETSWKLTLYMHAGERSPERIWVCQESGTVVSWGTAPACSCCPRPTVDYWWTWCMALFVFFWFPNYLVFQIWTTGIIMLIVTVVSVQFLQVPYKPPPKEQTRPVEFRLLSEIRAHERAEFDNYVCCWALCCQNM